MNKSLRSLSIIILLSFQSLGQETAVNGLNLQDSIVLANIPEWVRPILEKSEIAKKHKISMNYNPYYFEADFTGDKLIDIAFFVENTIDNTKGIMIINSGKNLVYIVGCGNPTELGSSLTSLRGWVMFRDKTIRNHSKKTVALKTPGVLVKGKAETNMVVYWSKNKYKTFIQQ